MAPSPADAAAALGLTPEVFGLQTALHEAEIFFNIALVFYGIMLWELVTYTPTEIQVVYWPEIERMRKGNLPSLPSVFLLCARLLVIPFVVIGIIFFGQPNSCQPILTAWCVIIAIATFLCLGIFVLRCSTIRHAGWPLQTWLWLNAVAVSVLWLVWAVSLTVDTLPMPLPTNVYGGLCYNLAGIPEWTYGIYIYTALFDLQILCLTLHATMTSQKLTPSAIKNRINSLSNVSQRFLSDSFVYFGFSFAVHTVEFAWVYTHKENGIFSGIILPIHAFVMLVIGARTITNLKTIAGGRSYVLPYSSGSGGLSAGKEPTSTSRGYNRSFGNEGTHIPSRSVHHITGVTQSSEIYSTQETSVSVDPPFTGITHAHPFRQTTGYEMTSLSGGGSEHGPLANEKGADDSPMVQFARVTYQHQSVNGNNGLVQLPTGPVSARSTRGFNSRDQQMHSIK